MAYSGHNIEYLMVGFHLNFLHISLLFTHTPQIVTESIYETRWLDIKKKVSKQNQNHLELWDIL